MKLKYKLLGPGNVIISARQYGPGEILEIDSDTFLHLKDDVQARLELINQPAKKAKKSVKKIEVIETKSGSKKD